MAAAADVADDLSRDDHIRADDITAHDAALADHDLGARRDRPFDRAVDAERALGAELTANEGGTTEDVLDRLAVCRARALVL